MTFNIYHYRVNTFHNPSDVCKFMRMFQSALKSLICFEIPISIVWYMVENGQREKTVQSYDFYN